MKPSEIAKAIGCGSVGVEKSEKKVGVAAFFGPEGEEATSENSVSFLVAHNGTEDGIKEAISIAINKLHMWGIEHGYVKPVESEPAPKRERVFQTIPDRKRRRAEVHRPKSGTASRPVRSH